MNRGHLLDIASNHFATSCLVQSGQKSKVELSSNKKSSLSLDYLKNEFSPFIKKSFLLERINYQFKDLDLLFKAFCHSSFTHEIANFGLQLESNERLEFLGDSIVNFIVGLELFLLHPNCTEGELTIMRGQKVSRLFLGKMGNYLDLQNLVLLGKGETKQKSYLQERIMANTFEALIGAIYLDSNFEECQKVVLSIFRNGDKEGFFSGIKTNMEPTKDPKSELSELMMKENHTLLYQDLNPDKKDNEDFYVAIVIDGRAILTGHGPSKKKVQKELAKEFLEKNLYQHFTNTKSLNSKEERGF